MLLLNVKVNFDQLKNTRFESKLFEFNYLSQMLLLYVQFYFDQLNNTHFEK